MIVIVNGEWLSAAGHGIGVTSGNLVTGQHPPYWWHREVWDNWCIPKHSIISWIIQHAALNTRDKLHRLMICDSNLCIICENGIEAHQHLFTECQYVKCIVVQLEEWLSMSLTGGHQRRTKLQHRVGRMSQAALYYTIWMERNSCRLEMKLRTPDVMVKELKGMIRARLNLLIPRPVGRLDRT
ncbi:uncharacterized protein LOC141594866 [Silene latifolia]|uniref:uncharacterized protein LOC141594866 n=1 Tax=Silene latifolia TaxID=37657 RepID=UPI003D76EB51